ncbi:hypothetical protein SAMN05216428_10171 [Nitrosospira sp. Nsp11]|uniref:hypothetical protein n=1 Tax=Nitrosospira sp. Nsp11 TaxID=1855338 RepID=UPI000912E19A|nr:hypothetical protein [Nitrosospira sp. Nsp11]SHL09994.1 hypothetical protein SAMN05216428_10171 [Nitrosospira sp. Nsp11]
MKKTVYLYDPVTLAPTMAYDAQESPLEPGTFITPIHHVDTPPPAAGSNQSIFFDGVDGWILKDKPVPTEAEKLESQVASYRLAVRQHMSAVAQAAPEHFNSISEAKSFAGIDNPYRAVSEAFVIWAAQVQTSANTTLDAVLAGTEPLPALADLITSLPVFVHP